MARYSSIYSARVNGVDDDCGGNGSLFLESNGMFSPDKHIMSRARVECGHRRNIRALAIYAAGEF